MSNTPPAINFDPATRAAQYAEVTVTANAVDPVTGANPGAIDRDTPLTFTYLQGGADGATPAAVTITQIAVTQDGARVLRFAPGVVQTAQPWSVRISAAGRTGTVTFTGTSPAPADVSGVSWNGVGPTGTQPA
ncbi:MAG TPA: hypothetical protein VFQ42_22440 [Mycobacterium sp.]|nr:hypothetical protein [Mycobacterium sp.]